MNSTKFITFLLINLTFMLISTVVGIVSRSSHGEACSKFQRCNSRQFLNCANGHYCDCVNPKTMIFDEPLNKCAQLVGEKCTNFNNLTTNEPPCVSNAQCNNGECKCLDDYSSTEQGACELTAGYGDDCSGDGICKFGLVCNVHQICSCDGNRQYNDKTGKCTKFLGESCITHGDCPESAICDPRKGFTCNCSPGHVISNDKCTLDSYLVRNISTTRRRKEEACSHGLIRRNGYCECKYKDHQEYSGGRCLSLIEGPCNNTEDCIPDAECVIENNLKYCRCANGFNPVDRRCEVAFGESCIQRDKYCDRLGPLQCNSNGKCDCSDFQIYDNNDQKCKGLVGSKCNSSVLNFCVTGAVCKPFRGFNLDFGICSCTPGLTVLNNRTCTN